MIKNLLVSLFAVFLFALGAAGSWYFLQFQEQQKQLAEGEHPTEEEDSHEAPTETAATSTTAPSDHGSSAAESHGFHGTSQAKESHGSDKMMASPVAGRSMTPEEIVRYGFQYKKNMEVLKQKNEELKNNELRLQLIQKDVDQKKMEIEGMLKQLQQTATSTELLLQEAQRERQALATERETLEQEKKTLTTEKDSLQKQLEESKKSSSSNGGSNGAPQGANQASNAAEQQNVERVALILAELDEAAAAATVKDLANKGNMEYVLQILDKIEPSDVAGILDAMGDPELTSQLTEAYRNLKRPESSKRR